MWSRASLSARVPVTAPLLRRVLGESLVDRSGRSRSVASALAGKIVAVYASASSAPSVQQQWSVLGYIIPF